MNDLVLHHPSNMLQMTVSICFEAFKSSWSVIFELTASISVKLGPIIRTKLFLACLRKYLLTYHSFIIGVEIEVFWVNFDLLTFDTMTMLHFESKGMNGRQEGARLAFFLWYHWIDFLVEEQLVVFYWRSFNVIFSFWKQLVNAIDVSWRCPIPLTIFLIHTDPPRMLDV